MYAGKGISNEGQKASIQGEFCRVHAAPPFSRRSTAVSALLSCLM